MMKFEITSLVDNALETYYETKEKYSLNQLKIFRNLSLFGYLAAKLLLKAAQLVNLPNTSTLLDCEI